MKQNEMWDAVKNNDENYDGFFYYAVKTTGIYCRPSCKSKIPNRGNIVYFANSRDAKQEGYRSCKRCRSDLLDYKPMKDIAEKVKKLIEETYLLEKELRNQTRYIGVTSHRINEVFMDQYGMTIAEFTKSLRLEEAENRLVNSDEAIIDIAYSVGFGSLSGFYSFFKESTGVTPARYRKINND